VTTPAPGTGNTGPALRQAQATTDALPGSAIVPVIMMGVGGYLMWFAVKYWRGTGPAVWPSYPVKSVLQGKGIPANQPAPTADANLATFESDLGTVKGGAKGGPPLTTPGGPNVHGNVTPRQAYVALRQAGVSAGASVYLVAIAGVESGYRTTALNTDAGTGDYSVGLWQINYFDGLYAERAPYIGTPQELLSGGLNKQAAAAAWLWRQDGLQPWEPDITSGKINAFMPGALAAAKGGP